VGVAAAATVVLDVVDAPPCMYVLITTSKTATYEMYGSAPAERVL
jgi:hypothetical protein